MFYSHEILASPKHGVATVWLVANLGHNASSRKLTRKAIENVNVPHACNTIEKPPGAPIALRLQGSLLYGVSGVYHKHGAYLLNDVEKVWACMRAYFREVKYSAGDTIDQNAGKAKRNQIVLGDDPSFVPDPTLPPLDFDDNGDLILPIFDVSQKSHLYSQLSPVGQSSNSVEKAPFINLDFRNSSSHASLGFGSPFGKGSQNLREGSMFQLAFGGEEELPFADFPIRIDADGNLIEEPELPPHPVQHVDAGEEQLQKNENMAQLPDDDDVFVVFGDDEAQIPTVDGASGNPQPNQDIPLPSQDPLSSDPARQARSQQQKRQYKTKKNKALVFDTATHISRPEFKAWGDNYLIRIAEAHKGPQKVTTSAARSNAFHILFGKGLGNIGTISSRAGVSHELADIFAGEALQDLVMGDFLATVREEVQEDARGSHRRRSASAAFGSDDEHNDEDNRRVRPRVEVDKQIQQTGNSQHDAQIVDGPMVVFDDDAPEFGREQPGSALSDHRHSSNVPWNRPSSLIPSSVRSAKVEGGRHAVQSSPLVGRGSILQQADAHFDDAGIVMPGSDDFGTLQHDDDVLNLSAFNAIDQQEINTSQVMRRALDREGRNFLGFVERVAAEHGEQDQADKDLNWIGFDNIFEPQDQTRAVAAQAFLHVLTLATKNQIRVKQEGVAQNEPFGDIRVGVLRPLQADQEKLQNDEMEGVQLEGGIEEMKV